MVQKIDNIFITTRNFLHIHELKLTGFSFETILPYLKPLKKQNHSIYSKKNKGGLATNYLRLKYINSEVNEVTKKYKFSTAKDLLTNRNMTQDLSQHLLVRSRQTSER